MPRPIEAPTRRRRRPRGTALAALLAALLLALPAAAYTVYLKDGSRLTAQKEYEVRDGKAYIVLQSGTTTFIDLDEIDVERTRRANRGNLGTATIIEGGETRETAPEPPPAGPTLGDLIQQRTREGRQAPPAAPRNQPSPAAPAPRGDEPAAARTSDLPRPDTTAAGFPDLVTYPRQGFSDRELGAELRQFFLNQGLNQARVFQGTAPARPLVAVTANSEASVFRALAVAASALVHIREQGRTTDSLELALTTPRGERAGQFVLTPELARTLLTSEVDIATFYLQNVQF